MIFKLWETVIGYFKEKPYWSKIQPLLTLISLYIVAEVLAYQFIEWQYRISPSLSLYLRSYIFKQITIAFVAFGVVAFLLSRQAKRTEGVEQGKVAELVGKYARGVLRGVAVTGLVLVILVPVFLHFSPHGVSHVRVKFLKEPGTDFNKYALVYLIYELNRLQKNWYYEIDFDVFDETVLTSREREGFGNPNRDLCYAELIAHGQPFIGITMEQLGEDFFWQNRKQVSVISTFRWKDYAPPSVYEFLTYSLIVQSILIHLDAHSKGLPNGAFKESRVAYGDLFQFSPRRNAMKAAIMAAHLSPKGEELLLNCFGVEYMSVCSRLLTLEWLHSERIAKNLAKSFGVKL